MFAEQRIVPKLVEQHKDHFVGVRGTLHPKSRQQLMMFADGVSRMIAWVISTFALNFFVLFLLLFRFCRSMVILYPQLLVLV